MGLLTIKFTTDVRDQDYEVVEFHGELDQSTIPNTEKQMEEFLSSFKRPYLIFDFSNLKYTNSEGMGFMMTIHIKLSKQEQKLLIVSPRGNVLDILNAIGFPKMIPVLENMQKALEFIKK